METTKHDTRGRDIKKLLQKSFPSALFSVKLHKYSMGESININTSLLMELPPDNELIWKAEDMLRNGKGLEHGMPEHTAWKARKEAIAFNDEMVNKIKMLIGSYESIDRDAMGEILSGGNTYINIRRT